MRATESSLRFTWSQELDKVTEEKFSEDFINRTHLWLWKTQICKFSKLCRMVMANIVLYLDFSYASPYTSIICCH